MLEMQWADLLNFYAANRNLCDLGVGLIVIGFFVAIPIFLEPATTEWKLLVDNFRPKRRGKMLRKQRRRYVQSQAVDGFVDFVEERVAAGEFTREEAKELYRNLKKCFPIRDLFPSPELLKEAIRKRIASGTHAPVELPDKKPVKKRKHAFDKAA